LWNTSNKPFGIVHTWALINAYSAKAHAQFAEWWATARPVGSVARNNRNRLPRLLLLDSWTVQWLFVTRGRCVTSSLDRGSTSIASSSRFVSNGTNTRSIGSANHLSMRICSSVFVRALMSVRGLKWAYGMKYKLRVDVNRMHVTAIMALKRSEVDEHVTLLSNLRGKGVD
jgi:hypothetical protein